MSSRFTAIPAQRSNAVKLRARLFLVLGLLGFAAFMGVISTFAWVAHAPKPIDPSLYQPHARGLAEVVARDYLSGLPFDGVPTASTYKAPEGEQAGVGRFKPLPYFSLEWDRFEIVQFGKHEFELDHFVVVPTTPLVASPSSNSLAGSQPPPIEPLDLTVTSLLTPNGPLLVSSPSIQLWHPTTANDGEKGDYTDYHQVPVTQYVQTSVNDWAAAYAAGDDAGLLKATGDQRPGVAYHGLGGFTASNVTITSAVSGGSNYLFVRARVQLTSAKGFTSDAEFDLLVGDAQAGQPPILAWGPAGSAAELSPYQNAEAKSS